MIRSLPEKRRPESEGQNAQRERAPGARASRIAGESAEEGRAMAG